MKRRRVTALLVATTALALAAGIAPARAQGTLLVALPGSFLTPTYGMPGTVVQVGGELTFVNLDAQPHDVQAVTSCNPRCNEKQYAPVQCPAEPGVCDPATPFWCMPPNPTSAWTPFPGNNQLPFAPGWCPVIWSPLISIGIDPPPVTPVYGLEYLTSAETYDFFCSRHPLMRGVLLAV